MIDEARLSDLLARGDLVWITPGERDEVEALAEVVEPGLLTRMCANWSRGQVRRGIRSVDPGFS